jgi:hypothetical protein
MLTYNKTEVDRTVANNAGGSQGRTQTVGVFVPECSHQAPFRAALAQVFEDQKDPVSDTKVATGHLPNQIVIMKIASMMPVRFVETLAELKRHYDGLLKDHNESFLLHGSGDGRRLPSLYARSSAELQVQARRKPMLLVARLMGMVKERQNRTTGLPEWAFIYQVDGLPTSKVLHGSTWDEVLHGEHPAELEQGVEREVNRRIEAEFKHVDRKNELLSAYKQFASERFVAAGEDDQDPAYMLLHSMNGPVRSIIGLAA